MALEVSMSRLTVGSTASFRRHLRTGDRELAPVGPAAAHLVAVLQSLKEMEYASFAPDPSDLHGAYVQIGRYGDTWSVHFEPSSEICWSLPSIFADWPEHLKERWQTCRLWTKSVSETPEIAAARMLELFEYFQPGANVQFQDRWQC